MADRRTAGGWLVDAAAAALTGVLTTVHLSADDVLLGFPGPYTVGRSPPSSFPAHHRDCRGLSRCVPPRFAQDSDENRFSVMGHQLNFAKVAGYLPGNGALLQAVAAMAAGFDDSADTPGFPADWGVRHEGLHRLP